MALFARRVRGEAHCQSLFLVSRKKPLTPTLSPQVRGEGEENYRPGRSSRLSSPTATLTPT
jgi:hypothetical protein